MFKVKQKRSFLELDELFIIIQNTDKGITIILEDEMFVHQFLVSQIITECDDCDVNTKHRLITHIGRDTIEMYNNCEFNLSDLENIFGVNRIKLIQPEEITMNIV